MHSNQAHVVCHHEDCQAEYDQYVDPKAWEEPYKVDLPQICGVCGAKSISVTEARGHKVRC
jgi:hypothetical protein